MGLSNSVHWLAWFMTSFTQMSITMAVLTVMLKFGHVLTHSNAFIVFITLELFAVATIAFSYVYQHTPQSILAAVFLLYSCHPVWVLAAI